MIRLNDVLRLDDPRPTVSVVRGGAAEAAIVRATNLDHLIDTDDWCMPDLATWRDFAAVKPGARRHVALLCGPTRPHGGVVHRLRLRPAAPHLVRVPRARRPASTMSTDDRRQRRPLPADVVVPPLDVGGTKLAAGVVTGDGRVLSGAVVPAHAKEGPWSMIDRHLELGR